MGRILLAFRAFFGVLFNGETASRVTRSLTGIEAPTDPTPAPVAPADRKSVV